MPLGEAVTPSTSSYSLHAIHAVAFGDRFFFTTNSRLTAIFLVQSSKLIRGNSLLVRSANMKSPAIQLIEKVAAIIIQDGKLLLVSANQRPFFWTPGGKIETNESPAEALRRELNEELGVQLTRSVPYFDYLSTQEEDGTQRRVYCFTVEYLGTITPSQEIDRVVWASSKDLAQNKYPLQIGVAKHLLPKLFKDKLL